jgi:hypothetical protein
VRLRVHLLRHQRVSFSFSPCCSSSSVAS